MNLRLNTSKLKKAIKNISSVVSNKKTELSAYKNVEMRFTGGLLYFYAFNGSNACEILCDRVDTSENFVKCLNFSAFKDIITKVDADYVSLTLTNNSLMLSENGSKYNLQVSTEVIPKVFSDFSEDKSNFILSLNIKNLSSIYNFVLPCLPKISSMSYLNGVFFDGNFVTSDSSSVAIYSDESFNTYDGIFMSEDSFKILANISDSEDENIDLYLDSNKLIASNNNSKYLLSLMSNDFFKYKLVYNKINDYEYKIVLDRNKLYNICNKLVSFSSKINFSGFAIFNILKDSISIAIKTGNQNGEEIISIENSNLSDENFMFKLDLSKLYSYIKCIDDTTINMMLNKDLKNYVIKGTDISYITSLIKYNN